VDAASRGRRKSSRGDRIHVLGLSFDRLALHLGIGAALLVILPLSVLLLFLARRQYDRALDARHRAAELENRILEVALRRQMLEKDTTLMATVLHEITKQSEVQGVRILNHEGEVKVASDSSLVGTRFEKTSPECMRCHAVRAADRPRRVIVGTGDTAILRSVLPIANSPECHGCHDPADRLNGILILDVSLRRVEEALARDVAWIIAGAAALALFVLGSVGLLVRWLALVRLARLGRSARRIAAGGPHEPVDVGGHDIITSLAVDFDHMATSLGDMVYQLRLQEARLTNIVNSLNDGLVVLDQQSCVVTCNDSFARRIGETVESAQGRTCHASGLGTLPCCGSGSECPADRCRKTGTVQRALFTTTGREGGDGRVVEVYASPVFDDDGRVEQVVEIWRDITERVREEERLAEIERLVSLGALASGFSHEVNTPLATMLTCAEAIVGRLDDSARADDEGSADELHAAVRESANMVRTQVLRCRKITAQFLRFSRGVPPSIEPLDLGAEILEVVSLVRPTARESGVQLRVECGHRKPPIVRANKEVVHHVLLNLLVNALQSCENRRGEIALTLVVGADTRVEIRDSGCGIAEEDRRGLFEPFRSRKPNGTGLGLFLSRSFMRRFGGDVLLADSTVGRGSTFHVVFASAIEPAT